MTDDNRMIIIEHSSNGTQYAVLPKDFVKGAEGQYKGFKALRYEDGGEYEPKPKAEKRQRPSRAKSGKAAVDAVILPVDPAQSE